MAVCKVDMFGHDCDTGACYTLEELSLAISKVKNAADCEV